MTAQGAPSSFIYQGQIIKSNGSALSGNPTTFTIQIVSPGTEACVLYKEKHFLNMTGSEGVFSLAIGTGVRSGTDFEDTSSLLNIFLNTANFATITHCAQGSSYAPSSLSDRRKLRLTYNDGSGDVTLAQDHNIQSVPFAWDAKTIDGLAPANFVQINSLSNLTQAKMETLFAGTNYNKLLGFADGTNPVVTSGVNGAAIPSFSSDPASPPAGSMWMNTTTNEIRYNSGTGIQIIGAGGGGAVSSVYSRTGAVVAVAGDYTATQITNTAAGNIAAATTQAAINELDTEKVAKAGDTVTGALILNGTLATNAAVTSTAPINLNAQNEIRFADSDSSNYVALRSSATVAANVVWTLPIADGSNGTVLTTNGSGVLAWSAPGYATSVNANTGSAAVPSISFITEGDTGFYNSNSNSIGVAGGGFQIFEFNPTGLQSSTSRGALVTTAAGSAANPTYAFAGDPDTGWYSPSANVLRASTGGSDRVSIDGSGNVGIGTNLPATALDVSGAISQNNSISESTLSAVVNIADSSISLVDASTYPNSGLIFLNAISSPELISYSSKSGNTLLGLVRGFNGTTAQAHASGKTARFLRMASLSSGGIPNGFWLFSSGAIILGTPEGDVNPGAQSFSLGSNSKANGSYSFAAGSVARALGNSSMASGAGVTANASNAQAFGENTTASSFDGMVIGRYNVGGGTSGSWVSTDPVFEIGIGTGSGVSSANAMTVLKNGYVGIGTSSPAVSLDLGTMTDAVLLPKGTTAQQPGTPAVGMIRYNTTNSTLEYYNGSWATVSTGGAGSYLSSSGGTLSGALTVSSGGASITGGINANSGNITSVGANLMGAGALTVAAGGLNQNLSLNSSGTGASSIGNAGGIGLQVLDNGASTVNYVTVKGATTGNAPTLGVGGSDTNIDLKLTPKGTGNTLFTSGNVGIGTTAPAALLHLAGGTIRVDNESGNSQLVLKSFGTANQPVLYGQGARGTIASPTATQFGDQLLRMVTDGYGASANARAGELKFLAAENFTNSAGGSDFTISTSPLGTVLPSEKLRVTAAGYVGIGTTTPAVKLHVVASTASTNNLGADWQYGRTSTGTPVAGFGAVGQFVLDNSANTQTPAADFGALWVDPLAGSEKGAFIIRTRTGGTLNERFRLDNLGYVGIGTTTPQTKLEVSGQIHSLVYNAGSTMAIDWQNGNNQYTAPATNICAAITSTNLLDGGTYTLGVQGVTSGTCTFSQAGLTFVYSPANSSVSTDAVYTFLRLGTKVYVSWVTGFQ